MRLKHLYWFIGFTVIAVLLLAAIWKFGIEEAVDPYLWGEHIAESPAERWEFVIMAAMFVALSMVLPLIAGRKLIRRVRELEIREDAVALGFGRGPEAMFVTDQERRITAANARCSELFACELDRLIGSSFRDMIAADPPSSSVVEMELALREEGVWKGRIEINPDADHRFLALLTVSTVRDDLGNLTSFIGIVQSADQPTPKVKGLKRPDSEQTENLERRTKDRRK